MKNLKLGIIAFLCLTAFTVKAQKSINEGFISYNAEYDLAPDQQMAAAMLPKLYTVYFKGDVSKFTMDLGMMSNKVISNTKTSTGLMLMEIPAANQKIAVKMTPQDKEKQKDNLPDYTLTKTSETKTINGYKAVKYNAKDKNSDGSIEIWTTTDITTPINNFTEGFKGIEGTPVAFTTDMNGIKVKLNLKEIKQETVTGLEMNVPAGFTEMTMDELMAMSGR
ncbi:MAG: DUF4412 domain-containing protein [Pedobacter sp.]|nr:MAG: DUF4412 domain-containing protein [Pedobacter sp.]